MVKVETLPQGMRLSSYTSSYEYGVDYLMGVFWKGTTESRGTVDGFITHQEQNAQGDRGVKHVELTGTIYPYKDMFRRKTETNFYGSSYDFLQIRFASQPARWINVWCPVFAEESVGETIEFRWNPKNGKDPWDKLVRVHINSVTPSHLSYWYETNSAHPGEDPPSWSPWYHNDIEVNWNQLREFVYLQPSDRVYHPWQFRLTDYDFRRASNLAFADELFSPKGDLCMEAVEGTKAIDINTLMYVKELLETGKMVKSTIQSAMDLKKDPAKAIANLYLSWHYGYRLSVQDTLALGRAAAREVLNATRTIAATRARRTEQGFFPLEHPFHGARYERTRCCKVWYRQLDDGIESVINNMFRWDVFPELGNVYDMIPYSFVLDWFVPLGDIWDKIDYHTYSSTLRVLNVVYSDKVESELDINAPFLQAIFRGYSSNGLTLKVYHRWIERELSYPRLVLELQAGPGNWIPAGALIVQRIR